MGNIDCIELLPSGTVVDVVRVVRDTIHRAAQSGGGILASANSIHKDVKPENAVAMFHSGREFGQYPIT